MKKVFLAIAVLLFINNQTQAQGLLGKLKDKLNNGSKKTEETKGNSSKTSTKSTLTAFQRNNLKNIVFFSPTQIDANWNGESESDVIKEIELGMPLIMKYYFDNGGWNSEKDKYLDVRFIADGISFTGREFVKYAYDIVEKAPQKNTFGNFVKFETAISSEGIMMQRSMEMVTGNLVSPRGAYIPLLMRSEDTFRYFLATKLKSKLTPGNIIDLKVEIYRVDNVSYSPGKPPTAGEVYASGEIKIKVTSLFKKPDCLLNRFFSEGMVSPKHSEGAAKTIALKFPTTVKKVHKVFFLDQDFATINNSLTGAVISGYANAWVLFETQDGTLFNTKTKLTFPYNGSGFGTAPTCMDSGLEEATFPILTNPFAK